MSVILTCKNLSYTINNSSILENFNCEIVEGELVSILGASGCGKTTLLRLCAGLEKPTSGEIFLRDRSVAKEDEFVSAGDRRIGFVFQNFALFEKVSVEKNIHYPCSSKQDYEYAKELVDLMGLRPHMAKKPCQLSGGERQRVALARSLVQKPDIVFLDEPFSSIDPSQTQFLINEIKKIFKTLGVTALMVTHSREESSQFSDRVIEL